MSVSSVKRCLWGTNHPNMEETGSLENPIPSGKCYLDLNRALFLNVTTRSDLIESLRKDCKPLLCVIHPELYSFKDRFFLINIMDAEISARDAFKLFSIRLRKAIQRRIPGRKV